MKAKKVLALALTFVLCLGILSACGSSSTTTPTQTTTTQTTTTAEPAAPTEEKFEKVELKMSHHPYVHALPGIYASENGMFDDYFDYSIDIYANGPVQNEAIASGSWEVGTTGLGGAVIGVIGYNMKILGFTTPDTNTTSIWVRGDSPLASASVDESGVYGTADDWRGLTILCNRGTVCHMVLIATLEHLGLTEDDVNIIDASVANCYTAFVSGEGDVVCIWDAMCQKAEANGWVEVSSAPAVGIELPALLVCTEEAYKNKPESVKKWLEIYFEATDILLADADLAAAALYDYQTSEGISVTEDDCATTIVLRPFYTLEDQQKFFTPGPNGTSRAYDVLMEYAAFMLSQGNITQEAYDQMAASDFALDYVVDLYNNK